MPVFIRGIAKCDGAGVRSWIQEDCNYGSTCEILLKIGETTNDVGDESITHVEIKVAEHPEGWQFMYDSVAPHTVRCPKCESDHYEKIRARK